MHACISGKSFINSQYLTTCYHISNTFDTSTTYKQIVKFSCVDFDIFNDFEYNQNVIYMYIYTLIIA